MVAEFATTPQEELDTAPHSLDAEQAFLGALLYDNDLFHQVAFLRPEHFYDPVHGRIFEAAAAIISAGRVADAVVLKGYFEQDAGLAEIGGTKYLAVLVDSAATGLAAAEYARMVFALHRRRQLIAVADEIGHAARQDADAEVEAIIEEAEGALFALAEQGTASRGFQSFKAHLARAIENAAAAYEHGGMAGVSTGLRDLDTKLGGLHPSDLIILAGRPSMGKSALATNIAFDAARSYEFETQPDGAKKTVKGGVVGFYSLEMSGDQLAMRILADVTGIPSWRIREGKIDAAEYGLLRDASQEIANLPIHIDDTGGLSIAALCARARRLKRTHGLDLIVVDYLQLGDGTEPGGNSNRVQEITRITTGLKALAKELGVPVLALSQLSRQVENRPDKKPQLSDLRESGSIEQDADVVLFVYRDAYYKEREKPRQDTPEYFVWEEEFRRIEHLAEVIIGKQRHGPIGTVNLHFDGERTKFSDLEGER